MTTDQSAADRRAGEILALVGDTAKALAEAEDIPRLVDVIVDRLTSVIGDACAAFLLSEDGKSVVTARRSFLLEDHADVAEVIRSGDTSVVTRREGDAANAALLRRYSDLCGGEAHSLLFAPVQFRTRAIGVIVLTRFRVDLPPFDDRDIALTKTFADLAALTIGRLREVAAFRENSERASKSRFARLEQVGILGVVVTDPNGRLLEVNDTVLAIMGYSREEALAEDFRWVSLTAPESVEVDQKAVHDLEQSGVAGLREKKYIRKDGARVWAMVASARIDQERTISFVLDLTERKRAEAALREATDRKAADEVRFRLAAIVESSDDAIIGKTLDGIITSWNGGAERLFGYAADEAIGKPVSILIPQGAEAEEARILTRLRAGGVDHFDTVRRRKDGRTVAVSVTSSPVYDSTGKLVGASKVARDITSRKDAEARLSRAKETADDAVRELEAFSYSVAHDLRAPLRGMNGFAQVLINDYADKLDEDGKDCLQEILSNTTRMGNLIDAMLSLAHITRSSINREDVDLSAMVQRACDALRIAEPDRSVGLAVAASLRANVDRILVGALVDNLVENAWKFTRKTAAPEIEFGAVESDGAVAYFVRDNGAGFDMAFAGKLFAPFQRLHRAKDFPGTGIGLANAQRIVHRHGGRIWAEGAVGNGATFFFTLPNDSVGAAMT